jgi:SAM-dependent methyltransferase
MAGRRTIYVHGTSRSEQRRLADLNRATNPAFLRFLRLRRGMSVLEVGCGMGLLLAEVDRRVGASNVTGVDLSAAQLARVPSPLRGRVRRGDAHDLPFAAGSFDLVYARYLLEHVADPQKVVRQMARVARPGGVVIAQENDLALLDLDPRPPAFAGIWQGFCRWQVRCGGHPFVGRHLGTLFRRAGLRGVELSFAPESCRFGDARFPFWISNVERILRGAARGLRTMGISADGLRRLLRALRDHRGALRFSWNRARGYNAASDGR